MRFLRNFTGGRGYYTSDAENLQLQLDTLKTKLFADLGAFVVSGCEYSGGQIQPGLVYMNGNLIDVPDAITPGSSFPLYMRQTDNVNIESRSYNILGITQSCAAKVGVALSASPDPGSFGYEVIPFDADGNARRIEDALQEKFFLTAGEWTNLSLQNGWTSDLSNNLQYWFDPNGWVRLRGKISGNSASSTHFATLPQSSVLEKTERNVIDLYQLDPYMVPVAYNSGATFATGYIEIKTDGQLHAYKADKSRLDVTGFNLPSHPLVWTYSL